MVNALDRNTFANKINHVLKDYSALVNNASLLAIQIKTVPLLKNVLLVFAMRLHV